jgi:drug/metabolite transporter (DMT)-like permease
MKVRITSRKRTLLADAGLLYAAAIWGSTFFLVKGALADVDPLVLVAYRFLLAGGLLLGYLLVARKSVVKGLRQGVFLAVILWLLYVPQTVGLGITTASNSGFITGLFVFFVPLFLRTLFKRRPTMMELTACGVSLAGLWVLTGGLREFNVGDALTLVAATMYALHLLYSDKYMKAGIDPWVISCQQFLLVGLFSLAGAFVFRLPLAIGSSAAWFTVIFLALFPTLSAFVIQMLAQKITSPVKVSLIFALEPAFAGVFAWTLGGERFILRSALGGVLIIAALIISGLPSRQK